MARRKPVVRNRPEPVFGPAARTPEEAFLRFGNALHWEADLAEARGAASDADLVAAALARLPRAEHRLVADFIDELLGGRCSFTQVRDLWRRSESDCVRIGFDGPDQCLRFLLQVRDRIDLRGWPASRPHFRVESAPDRTTGTRHTSSGKGRAPR